jgi:crotonobetaine/carnitine-CoA ligase
MPKDIFVKIKRKKAFDAQWYLQEKRTDWVLPLVLKARAKKLQNKPFLQYQNQKPLTFEQVNALANKIANGLIKMGVKKGERVAVLLTNCTDYVLIWFGILKAGAVMAPINTAYKMDFLQYVIDNSDSRVLFVSEEYLDRIAPIQDKIPQLERIVVWKRGREKELENMGVNQKPLILYNEFIRTSSAREPDTDIRFIDVARLMYTSGTTGRSKGVIKSHAADYYSARGYVEAFDITRNDVLFTCLPLFHSNAQVLSIYLSTRHLLPGLRS